MKTLVQECPSYMHVDLGNRDTNIDFSAIMGGTEPRKSSEDFGNAIGTTGSERTRLGPNRSESDDAQSDEDHETKEESRTSLKCQSDKVHNESDIKKCMIFPFAQDINC